jgi:hypothetical protein
MRTIIIAGVIGSIGVALGFRWLVGKLDEAIGAISLEEIREEHGPYYDLDGP